MNGRDDADVDSGADSVDADVDLHGELLVTHSEVKKTLEIYAQPASSLALKVRRRGEEGHALIHDRLAHPQVVVQPLLHARGVAELLGLHTGTERQPVSLLAMLWAFRGDVGGLGVWRREVLACGRGWCMQCCARHGTGDKRT